MKHAEEFAIAAGLLILALNVAASMALAKIAADFIEEVNK